MSTSVKIKPSEHGSYGKNDPFGAIEILWIDIDCIEDAPRRIRRPLEKQIEAVKRSIARYGNRIPILVAAANGLARHSVIDGHSRLAAAQLLGAEKVPCIVVDDLPEIEVRRLALSLNKLQENGHWDPEAVQIEINEIIEFDNDFDIPGYELPEIEAVRFGAEGSEEPDPADTFGPDATSVGSPVTKPDDVWFLGNHMIVCRSSRDSAVLASVLDNQAADVIFTDPPYNVKISGNVRSATSGFKEFAEGSGEMSRDEFVAFLIQTLGSATNCLKPGGVIFSCMDWRHHVEMDEALAALELKLLNICVWTKTNAGMGSLYRSQHELVFVARKSGASHLNNVELGRHGRNRTNVWAYAGATGGAKDPYDDFHLHATVKPIRLVMDALLDVSAPDGLVLDPFLGSGTTLLAAERVGRRCVGVEIEPAYVDVAIRRWQEMTGRMATHADTGSPFNEFAQTSNQIDVGAF